ncbi:MAG TPA: hypothetical protein VNL74_11130 [Methylococcus sp.]|nr:hypothetical protein [Methylococcus sp.]
MYELSGYIVEEHWIVQRLLDRERKCLKKVDVPVARIAEGMSGRIDRLAAFPRPSYLGTPRLESSGASLALGAD